MARVNYEDRFRIALQRITAYMTPAQLRCQSDKQYGLGYEEALEYAYENVRAEARAALKGYRAKSTSKESATRPRIDRGIPSDVVVPEDSTSTD